MSEKNPQENRQTDKQQQPPAQVRDIAPPPKGNYGLYQYDDIQYLEGDPHHKNLPLSEGGTQVTRSHTAEDANREMEKHEREAKEWGENKNQD
jgi:hypothetical protein